MVEHDTFSVQPKTGLFDDNLIHPGISDPWSTNRPNDVSLLGVGSSSTHADNIVFIDEALPDYQSLKDGVVKGDKVVLLDPNGDEIAQITNTLSQEKGVHSIHLVSHGNSGSIQLGNTQLNSNNLAYYKDTLASWHKALAPDASLLVYGCNVAAGQQGLTFVNDLSTNLGAVVAASTDLTGSAALGGNWQMEYRTGKVDAPLAFESWEMQAYNHVLDNILTENFAGSDVNKHTWIYGTSGTGVVNLGLTARSGPAAPGGLPGQSTGDTPGNGALRLTSNGNNQVSFVIYNQPINAASGLSISFDLYSYGGTGADGISFSVIDGSKNPTTAGSPGGGLGYSNTNLAPGIVGGYFGIGFDEFGNFSSNFGSGGPGKTKESVAIRGSEGTGYKYLTGTTVPAGTSIDNVSANANRSNSKRHVQIDMTPNGQVSVQMDLNNDGIFEDNEKLIANFDVTANNAPLPKTFKFGFSASTGDLTNYHEINNFKTDTYGGASYIPLVNFTSTSGTVSENGSLAINAQLDHQTSSSVTVPLTLTGTAVNGQDYIIPTSITFAPNQTTGSVTLIPTDNKVFASDKTVTIAMGTPTNAQLSPQNNVLTETILNSNAPSLNVSSRINYTKKAPPTAIAPSLSIGNADSSATLTGAKVQIISGLSSNEDLLGILGQSGKSGSISNTKITWSYDNNTGGLTFSGNDSVANYQSALRQVAYSDTSGTASTQERTIGYSLQYGNSKQTAGSNNSKIAFQAATTITNTTSVNPALFGQTVTLTGSVSAVKPGSGIPTGKIAFMEGSTTLGTATLDQNGSASLLINTLSLGTHNISEIYSGDSNFTTSNAAIAQTIAYSSFNFESQLKFLVDEGQNLVSLLFNNNYYLAQNPDVAAAVASGQISSGLQHFLQYGEFEGRDPSLLFDNKLYLAENPDVAASVAKGQLHSGFEHFLKYGLKEHRDLRMLLFDEGYYLAQNPDVKAGKFGSGFEHYLQYGQKKGRNPSAEFNEAYYLANNPDVANAVTKGTFNSGFDQFVRYGIIEGRSPIANFDNSQYLSTNPDLTTAVAKKIVVRSGVEQAVRYGQYEGRGAFGLQLFDEQFYLAQYPDVASGVKLGKFTSGFDHFVQYGQKEGRLPSTTYSESFYLAKYPDVASAVKLGKFQSGFEHFITFGRAEGRVGIG